VQTTATKATSENSRIRSWPFLASVVGFLILLPARRWRRQYLCRALLIFAILGIGAAAMGCGGGFAMPSPSQTYTLTITGSTGTVTHSTTVLLTVKQ
jgi:CHASE2 domain-containing sensor protein